MQNGESGARENAERKVRQKGREGVAGAPNSINGSRRGAMAPVRGGRRKPATREDRTSRSGRATAARKPESREIGRDSGPRSGTYH